LKLFAKFPLHASAVAKAKAELQLHCHHAAPRNQSPRNL
jgi:hypothetical protein